MNRSLRAKHGPSRWLLSGVAAMGAVALLFSVTEGRASAALELSGTANPAGLANRYIGAKKCKNCHKSEETGNQFGKWESMAHAKAFAALGTDEAKRLGAEHGVADPQKADECMKCHRTAFGVAEAEIKKGFDVQAGVQCETCHGPGEAHMKARMMAAAGGEPAAEVPAGEILTAPSVETCTACHNADSPSFKPFCDHEMRKKIRHLNPKKARTPEELAKLDACSCEDSCVCKKDSPDGKCRTAGD